MPPLLERVRALYEQSDVTVREIALLAGVTECMIYKYVRKYRWDRRETRRAAQGRERAVALSDAALAETVAAAKLRVERAAVVRDERARERMLALLTDAFVELATLRAERETQSPRAAAKESHDRCDRLCGRLGHAIIDQIERVLQEAPRGATALVVPSPLAGEGYSESPTSTSG